MHQPIHDEFRTQIEALLKLCPHSGHGAREDIRATGNFPSCHPEELAHVWYQQETLAYHKQGMSNETNIKVTYNNRVHQEVSCRLLYYKHICHMDIIYKYYPINEALY